MPVQFKTLPLVRHLGVCAQLVDDHSSRALLADGNDGDGGGDNAAFSYSSSDTKKDNANSVSHTGTQGNGAADAFSTASNGKQKAATNSESASTGKGSSAVNYAAANDNKKDGGEAPNISQLPQWCKSELQHLFAIFLTLSSLDMVSLQGSMSSI